MSEAGKGDTPRPVNKKRYDKNFERIFRKSLDSFDRLCELGDKIVQQSNAMAQKIDEDLNEGLSDCCDAPPWGEVHDGMAICSRCKEHATFEREEE